MPERKLYITLTAKPLRVATAENLPAVQYTVDLNDTSRIEMLELLRRAEQHLGSDHGTS